MPAGAMDGWEMYRPESGEGLLRAFVSLHLNVPSPLFQNDPREFYVIGIVIDNQNSAHRCTSLHPSNALPGYHKLTSNSQ